MLTLHIPRRIEDARIDFKGTDPAVVIVLAVAIGLMVVMFASIYFH